MSQDAALVPFGCGERHPLPVAVAPCSSGSACNLCDDLTQAFADDSATARKVHKADIPNSSANPNPQPPTPLLTPGQSMPLLPLTSWGTKLWVAIDGRAIDRHNRCGSCGGAVIVVVMLATGTLGTPLPPSCTTAAPTCHGAHTPAVRVPASACTRPSAATQLRCLSTCPGLRRVCPIYTK